MKNKSYDDTQKCLARLETWFASMCNGDWEHTYGIMLETLDNPGWMLTVELQDTPLVDRSFDTLRESESESDWLHCSVSEGVFRGSGGLGRLQQILTIFLDWAETSC